MGGRDICEGRLGEGQGGASGDNRRAYQQAGKFFWPARVAIGRARNHGAEFRELEDARSKPRPVDDCRQSFGDMVGARRTSRPGERATVLEP